MKSRTRHLILIATLVVDAGVIAVTAPNYAGAANIILALLMAKCMAFVGIYSFRQWRSTAAGRAVMGLMACFAAICLLGTATTVLGDYSARPFVRLGAFIAIGLTLMNLLLALIAAQRNGGNEE